MIIPRNEGYTNILNVTINNTIINNYGTSARAPAVVNIDKNVFDDESITGSMNRILSGHILVASEFLKENVQGFFYSKEKKGLFYHFTGVIWKEDVDNMHLRARLRSLDKFFTQIISFYSVLPITEINKSILDAANKQIVKFSDPHHLNKIIEGSQDFYYIPKFTDSLNSNKRLLAFDNGVYDLENNVFRQATMEDYLSITVGYDYEPTVETEFLWEFLRQILPLPHLLDYLLKRLADCLDGSIPNTIFLIISGNGANGKSQLFNLMEATMGLGYGRKIANTVLTRKRENANDTNSEMIDMKGKRFIFFSEPESGEKFNISCLKDLTGSETVKATAKYEGSSSFTIDAKMFIGCNVVPEITNDKAIWRRVRSLEFKSNFVDEPDPNVPNQYLREPSIPDKIRQNLNWRKAFMKILLTYYYVDIAEPDDVKRYTEALREENNDVETWCHENIERDPEFEAKQLISPKAHSHWLTKEEVKRALSLKTLKDADQVIVPFIQSFLPGINPVYKKETFLTPSNERKNAVRCWLGIRLRRAEFKTETKLYEWLKSKFPFVEREKQFSWTLNIDTNHFRRYDFFIKDFNILIELDGIQHFQQVQGWENVREIQRIDNVKNELALQNGYHVIRICQRIVWKDAEDWEGQLFTAISGLKMKKNGCSKILIGSIYCSKY
jgi:P4 family phage/plasmid primase-like protien